MYLPQLAQGWNFSVAGNAVVSFYAAEIMGQRNNSKNLKCLKRLAFMKLDDCGLFC